MQTTSSDPLTIFPLPAFNDNYIWTITRENSQFVSVVDPGDPQVVIDYIESKQLTLDSILITHYHHDHIGGIEKLLAYSLQQHWSVTVFGPMNEKIPHCTVKLRENDEITLQNLNIKLKVLDIPGHTLGHIAYVSGDALFCGDTLFSAGCGRLFEGTPVQMHLSLQKLTGLPDSTRVFCTHEYTLANLTFALTVNPTNEYLIDYYNRAVLLRENGHPTLPSTIGQEKLINPFVRVNDNNIQQSVSQFSGLPCETDIETFAQLRRWKDDF